ncbi:MAG: tail fiber domain-containing protein [Flavobacteriales bacterium]|nr:tail fiber domain-containing protein [Flavobacteriales bacterium]
MKLKVTAALAAIGLIFSCAAFAQSPQMFNYQGVARDNTGNVMAHREVGLRIAIMSESDPERPLYAEEHLVLTNKFGLFNLKIGAGEVFEGDIKTIDWGSSAHYLSVQMDTEGFGNYEQMGTSQLLSVPYALYAEKSGTAANADGSNRNDPNDWSMNGNSGTDDAINFIGTLDAQDLVVKTNGGEVARFGIDSALQITSGGRIRFGTQNAINMDGERNIHIGERAGNVSTGNQNAFIGYNAGQLNTTGEKNTFIGPTAGRLNTTGNQNAFIGGRAGFNNTAGSQNSFIGWQAGRDNTSGKENTFIGKYAGLSNTTGDANTYIGKDADGNPNLNNATAIGSGAFVSQSNSVVLGNNANVGIGTSAPAAKLHIEGDFKLVDGTEAEGYVLTSDSLGNASWQATATPTELADADSDTKIQVEESADEDIIRFDIAGSEAFRMEEDRLEFENAANSIFLGDSAGYAGTGESVVIGTNAAKATIRWYNVAIGHRAMETNNGRFNVAIGTQALRADQPGEVNVAIGGYSMRSITGYSNANVAIGGQSFETGSGSNNTYLGSSVARNANGSGNVYLGEDAGYNAQGSNNVLIGKSAGYNVSASNRLYIENSNSSSPLIYGEFNNNVVGINGKLGVGTQSPSDRLHVEGSIRMVDGNEAAGYIAVSDTNGTMVWTDPATLQTDTLSVIADADSDTKIQVEENGDEDIIRFDMAGTEFFRMDSGRLEVLNTGRSVFLGNSAGENDDLTTNFNVYVGYQAGQNGTTAERNTAIGAEAMKTITTGKYNVSVGGFTLNSITNGEDNIAIGNPALFNLTTGDRNISMGGLSLNSLVSGNRNIAIGFEAGKFTTGTGNVFIGDQAALNETGSNKLYIENSSSATPLIYGEFDTDLVRINGDLEVTGSFPIDTLNIIADADNDTKIQVEESADEDVIRFDVAGNQAAEISANANGLSRFLLTNANSSILINGGLNLSTGADNIFLGVLAGNAATTDSNNIFIGTNSGRLNTGSGSIFMGYEAGENETGSNRLYIDNSNTASPLIYGEFDNDLVGINGNLGVGTNAPEARLAVSGSESTTHGQGAAIRLTNTAAGGALWVMRAGATGTQTPAGGLSIANTGGYRMTINSSGNVGFGTTSPGSKLHVVDSFTSASSYVATIENTGDGEYSNGLEIKAGQNTQSVNNRFISFVKPNGTEIGAIRQITSSSVDYNTTSDERLKTNITPTAKGLQDLMKIEVKDYVYKEDLGKPQTGFIAQQVYEHYPNAVTPGTDVKTDPWMMDYGKMTPLLVKAVQDQQALIIDLQREIAALKKQLND